MARDPSISAFSIASGTAVTTYLTDRTRAAGTGLPPGVQLAVPGFQYRTVGETPTTATKVVPQLPGLTIIKSRHVTELAIAIRTGRPLVLLGCRLQAVAHLPQRPPHQLRRSPKPRVLEVPGQLVGHFSVQRNADIGLARVDRCSSSSSASNRPGCLSMAGRSPPPTGRNRAEGSIPAPTSATAFITVLRLIPEASATAVLPTQPNALAIDPATTQR